MPPFKTAEELYAIVNRMTATLQANDSLKAKCAQTDLSVGFTVTDLKAEFALRFAKGQVSSSTGSAKDTTVGVSLTSAVLDGIFSGKQDAESAYTYGSLSLRGSEYVAEGALRFMRDVIAAYKAATA